MFVVEDFVAACTAALAEESHSSLALREQIDRAVARPSDIETAVGDVSSVPAFSTWHRSPELTILHVVWPPQVDLFAHDHRMWAAIGLYGGQEDNRFFRRTDAGSIEERGGGVTLRAGESLALGHDTVHAVANRSREWTGSIHVYGGDYFAATRSMWPDPAEPPLPFDTARVIDVLESAARVARRTDD